MFVFYDLNDLILLDTLHLTEQLYDNQVAVLVSEMKLQNHAHTTEQRIRKIAEKGYLKIIPSDDSTFQFVISNCKVYRSAGKQLLGLIHFCKCHHAVLIVDEGNTYVRGLADTFNIPVFSLREFNKATLNNTEYIEFMMEVKKQKSLNQ